MDAKTVPEPREMTEPGEVEHLAARILEGEVFVLRQGLQKLGLFDDLVRSSLRGIRDSMGDETAAEIERHGFDRTHEWVDPAHLPRMTDAVYRSVAKDVRVMLQHIVRNVFPDEGRFYYEKSPNVRFHIPYELAMTHQKAFNVFAGSRGQGKITAHGPHRDSWVDCPDNVVNIWMAVGPVRRGNGLTVFVEDYRERLAFRNGYISPAQPLHRPMTFELQAGDIILFHSDHVHGSELNITDSTRFAISHRVSFKKPHFPYGHHHQYLHSALSTGPLRRLATLPAYMQMSYVADRFRRLLWKARGVNPGHSAQTSSGDESGGKARGAKIAEPSGPDDSLALSDLPVGSIRAISKTVCVGRPSQNEFVAMGRRCPHAGGDLTAGWIADGRPVCPMHNLSFDPKTGASACRALPPLKVFDVTVRGDRVYVDQSGSAPGV